MWDVLERMNLTLYGDTSSEFWIHSDWGTQIVKRKTWMLGGWNGYPWLGRTVRAAERFYAAWKQRKQLTYSRKVEELTHVRVGNCVNRGRSHILHQHWLLSPSLAYISACSGCWFVGSTFGTCFKVGIFGATMGEKVKLQFDRWDSVSHIRILQ